MPGLKSILVNTPNDTKNQRDLKSNTIQCIGFLLEAVKEEREQFEEDAKEIANAFMQMLEPGVLKDDDPQITSITQSLTQVSAILLNNFTPYLPTIMERLIKDAQADIDIKLEDAEIANLKSQPNIESGVTAVTLTMKGLEG